MAEGAEEQPCARSELHRQQNLSLVSVCLCLVLFAARTSDHFLSVLVAHEAVFFFPLLVTSNQDTHIDQQAVRPDDTH